MIEYKIRKLIDNGTASNEIYPKIDWSILDVNGCRYTSCHQLSSPEQTASP